MTSSTVAQTEAQALGGTLTRWRVMALVVGVVLGFMTVVGLPYRYIFDGEAAWYGIGWQLHGLLYMAYLVTSLDLAIKARWSPVRAVLVALAGTIPFMSFPVERKVAREARSTPA